MLKSSLGQYAVITANYWAFTLTDGALRMLVVLHFHQLGYSPFSIAMLFILYELFGVITNLYGGWLGAKIGLNVTMQWGLALQILALAMLLVDPSYLSAFYVMITQALSGIAKDLNKMSAKSTIKTLIKQEQQGQLYRWVTLLTGSKNALKGVGFFLGGLSLSLLGFSGTLSVMLALLLIVFVCSLVLLNQRIGSSSYTPKVTQLFSSNAAINRLSAARFFLFGSRDIWFAVALPVFLQSQFNWSHTAVGTTLSLWIIAYGIIQAITPKISQQNKANRHLLLWTIALAAITVITALSLLMPFSSSTILVIGLFIFGGLFAINSSIHSYLAVAYARSDGASLDIGFYYMANAAGRLVGILLSGWVYQYYGLMECLLLSAVFIGATFVISKPLPPVSKTIKA